MGRMPRTILIWIGTLLWLGVCVVGVTACGQNIDVPFMERFGDKRAAALETNSAPVTELNVVLHDSYYGEQDTNLLQPPVWTVPSGADVILHMENRGELNHNWAIVKPGVELPIPFEEGQDSDRLLYGAGMVYGNNQTTVTFAAPDVGQYQVICTVSGHYPFMQGRLIVE